MESRLHTTTITVRSYHADAYGHVNNARYLELLEEARWRLLEEGLDLSILERDGLGFVVVRIEIDYRQPAGVGDVLEFRSRLKRMGARSGVVNQKVLRQRDETLVAEADVTFVLIDRATGKPTGFSDELRRAFGAPDETS